MKITVAMFLCVALSLAIVPPALAQDTTTSPIYILGDGNIWQWTAASGLQPLTQHGHIQKAVLAPDGKHMAVLVRAPITIDALARTGGIGGGPLPGDIAIIDLATGALNVIAPQPPEAAFFAEDGRPDDAILRSVPAWSPDGARIAWTEIPYPNGNDDLRRLMIYDVEPQITEVAATNLQPSGVAGPAPMQVKWSGTWLILENNTLFTSSLGSTYHGFDTMTRELHSAVPTTVSDTVWVEDYVGISTEDRQLTGVAFTDGHWMFFDPFLGGEVSGLSSPELYSLNAPASSLALTYTIDASRWNYYCDNRTWNAGTLGTLDYHGCHITLSPDGQSLAYIDSNGALTVWDSGVKNVYSITAGAVNGIFWGPTGWRSTSTLSITPVPPPTNLTCGTALPPRLQSGGWA